MFAANFLFFEKIEANCFLCTRVAGLFEFICKVIFVPTVLSVSFDLQSQH